MDVKLLSLIAMFVLFIVAMIFMALSVFHFAKMVFHMRNEWWIAMLGPFSLLMPNLFDEVGKIHRVYFIKRFMVALPSMLLLFLIKELRGGF